jgi:hypothetical protein
MTPVYYVVRRVDQAHPSDCRRNWAWATVRGPFMDLHDAEVAKTQVEDELSYDPDFEVRVVEVDMLGTVM